MHECDIKAAARSIRVAALLVCAALAATAQNPANPLQSIAFLRGNCTKLELAGKDKTASCIGKLGNESFKNGRIGFTFIAERFAVISFSGMSDRQVKQNANRVTQPLDGVAMTRTDPVQPTEKSSATGTCTYTNPYAGQATVECSAQTRWGSFSASFVSDGKPPSIDRY